MDDGKKIVAKQASSLTTLLSEASEKKNVSPTSEAERKMSSDYFKTWDKSDQLGFVVQLLSEMSHDQHVEVNMQLELMLQRDFITLLPQKGLDHIAEKILCYLDAESLKSAELVSEHWLHVISDGMIWRKLIEQNVRLNPLWQSLAERRNWMQHLFKPQPGQVRKPQAYYRELFSKNVSDIENFQTNWRTGNYELQRIDCHSETSRGIYCLQFDNSKIVCGSRDHTIKIWNCRDLQCIKTLEGHTGSVLCLQYDTQLIASGSSDMTIRIWDIKTFTTVQTLTYHSHSVLHVRFNENTMISCSKDRSIVVWSMNSISDIIVRRVLLGHHAAVNAVEFDKQYIVSGSGDRTIRVWKTANCEFVRSITGHSRGVACLHYRENLIVTGSSDNSIRIWAIESGRCIRVLEGHQELVRCVRFDARFIISGASDGKIKVWDLPRALDPHSRSNTLCLHTFAEHTGRVFRLQFDHFRIMSSSHDDSVLIRDFLSTVSDESH